MGRIRAAALSVAVLALSACTSARPSGIRAPSTPSPAVARSSASTSGPVPSPIHSAISGAVPPLPTAARAADFVDIRSVVPDAIVDLRYATAHNFTGVRLYPTDARCLVHQSMVDGLRTAAARLRRAGYLLVFWDCYRPHAVQVRMFRIVPNPAWVAQPGAYSTSHESGRSVDVTLAFAAADRDCPLVRVDHGHCLLDMGTGFDDFTPRAYAYATDGLTALQVRDRGVLRAAMAAGGLTVYAGEWWHFDGPGADVHRPIVAVPLD